MLWSETLRDIRHAIRVLSKTPGFTTVATLTIALAIGMNAARFSVVNGLLLKRLPYKNAESIVVVWNTWPQRAFPGCLYLTQSSNTCSARIRYSPRSPDSSC